jgi:hypothetical protein
MAILKKKMAGKPAMFKKRKAQGGITLAKNPDTDEKNALKDVPKEGKMLANVNTKERGSAVSTAYKAAKNEITKDEFNAKGAKTKAGKILRTAGNVAAGAVKAGPVIGTSLLGAAASAVKGDRKISAKDKAEGRLYYSTSKERANQRAGSDSTAVAKKKMGGKMKKYQAGGVVGKQPKAKMVDPKGAFTKVQERTIAGKKKK